MKTYTCCCSDAEPIQIIASSKEKASCLAAELFKCRVFEVIIYEKTQP